MQFPLLASLLAGSTLGLIAAPALADEQPAPPATGGSSAPITPGEAASPEEIEPQAGDIVVIATRIRGQVDAPQPPVQVLDEEDIAAYGAGSITELLEQLAPQTGSGRGRGSGRPVVLLNGQRISGFREMRNIPPEAIRRMEILPEEVGLRYGYSADQRVVNFILKDDFSARTVEVDHDFPTRGGNSTTEVEASLFRTTGKGRLNLSISAEDTTPLFESERGVRQALDSLPTVAGDPDPAAFRTLIADSREISLNGTWTTGLGERGLAGGLTLNGAFTRADSTTFSGLGLVTLTDPDRKTAIRSFGDPLLRRTRTETTEAGVTYGRPLGGWQLTATLDGSHAVVSTLIGRRGDASGLQEAARVGTLPIGGPLPRVAPGPADRARSVSDAVTSLVTVVGRPLTLPAGEVSATVKAGFAWNGIASTDTRSIGETRLRRGAATIGANFGIPIASRRNDVLSEIGDLNLNLGLGADRLSDFGWITNWTTGLTWGITEKLNFQASYIVKQAAPGLPDLGNPLVRSFNVPVFDFARDETALVDVTTGGNRLLSRETQRDIKLGLNWELPVLRNSNVLVEYFRNNSDDVTAGFPLLTPRIEAAFPGRVTRDPVSGKLLAIDRRPITFANQASSRLRYGFNLGGSLGKARAGAEAGQSEGAGPRRGGFGRGFGGGRGGRGDGRGRWNFSLYHTVQFENRVTVADGGPVLDLLSGDAISGGGVARHSLQFEGGAFYRGFGLRLNGSWTAPTRVNGTGADGSTDLRFGALTRVDLRVFADLGQQKALTDASPFFKNSRISLEIDNLFDRRQRVTDASGTVPISYQPDLIDPQGRVIGLEFRKQF